jgi:hypothetical protein
VTDYYPCSRQGQTEAPLDWARNLWHTWFMQIGTIQYHVDLLTWELMLNATPELKGIIELGSGNGGLSLYLYMQTIQRGMNFATFDHMVTGAADTTLGEMLNLRAHCYPGDLFNGELATGSIVCRLLETCSHPVVLLCDDGDKPKEFRTFLPYLSSGDIIGTHDWGNEFSRENVPPELLPTIEPYFWTECETIGSLTRFWRKK